MTAIRKLMSVEQIAGATVVGIHGEDFGRIKDVLVDAVSSQIVYAIIAYGGLAGLIGSRLFAVPWDVLRFNAGQDAYVLDLPPEKLKDAPAFDRTNVQDIADPRWAEPLHKYYGSRASWYLEARAAGESRPLAETRVPEESRRPEQSRPH
jgi:sporulation protein YlmC with PRC-barrel domain